MLKEFKEFAMRGNVVDMATGIIIGGAFGGIVNSLVNDIIMPPVGVLVGGVDFKNLYILIRAGAKAPPPYSSLAAAQAAGAATFNYGSFINTVLNFVIIAASIFIMVKMLQRLHKPKAAAAAAPSREETLLAEIRDLLRDNPPRGGK